MQYETNVTGAESSKVTKKTHSQSYAILFGVFVPYIICGLHNSFNQI